MIKETSEHAEPKSFKHSDGNDGSNLVSLQDLANFHRSEKKSSSNQDSNVFHLDCDMTNLYGSVHDQVTKTADIQTEFNKAVNNVRSSIEAAFAPQAPVRHVEDPGPEPKPEAKIAAPATPKAEQPDKYERWMTGLVNEGMRLPVGNTEQWVKRIKEHPDDFFYYPYKHKHEHHDKTDGSVNQF